MKQFDVSNKRLNVTAVMSDDRQNWLSLQEAESFPFQNKKIKILVISNGINRKLGKHCIESTRHRKSANELNTINGKAFHA